jgi:hypothetical protein
MVTMTWMHTRTGKPMSRTFSTRGQALVLVMMIRTVVRGHPVQFDGVAV